MPIDYLAEFPIPSHLLSPKLRKLLEPVGLSADQSIDVACMHEFDLYGPQAEHLHLQMAVVPVDSNPIGVVSEAGKGVVAFSVPVGDEVGCCADFSPSISGYDYIVAAWGSGSFYSYNLAEKVWMALGLTPRCMGNDEQRLVYDDLRLPEFGVAAGEVSSDYHFGLKRDVTWTMSNEYLRRYLWLRGARGVRVFYYQAQLTDAPEIRALMRGDIHVELNNGHDDSWYKLDIRENDGGLLLQLWASVDALTSELCPEQSAEGICWPGDEAPMTFAQANGLTHRNLVYLDDRFLQKYEQSDFYNSTPTKSRVGSIWWCSPSYRGQWSFTECRRVGRNLIQVPMRALYEAKPDREILHARSFALDPAALAEINMGEEHVVAKVQRLLEVLLRLGDGLVALGIVGGINGVANELCGFDRAEIEADGWAKYPLLSKLAQVAPLCMSQQMFLTRCKSLHEVWQRIPNGYLKSLLVGAGCPRADVKDLKSLKLLQALLKVIEHLNLNQEISDAFFSNIEPENWKERHDGMAALFLNNDLRVADAHEVGGCLALLTRLGFDVANVNDGYGRALDFVLDGVIASLKLLADAIERLLNR